jgi:hypothetical protein
MRRKDFDDMKRCPECGRRYPAEAVYCAVDASKLVEERPRKEVWDPLQQAWKDYIEAEVKATCEDRGWGHQVRRKWSVRDRPVSESVLDDYEWKLIPSVGTDILHSYYVLAFQMSDGRFIFEHDNTDAGPMSIGVTTFTEIQLFCDIETSLPPRGWLTAHLLRLTRRFEPNVIGFS